MKIRYRISILAIATGFAFLPLLLAQTPARPGTGAARGTPDLSGVWDLPGATNRSTAGPGAVAEVPDSQRRGTVPRQGFSAEEPPMQPWAAAKYKQARQGVSSLYQSGGDEFDPTHSCFPHGFPRIYTTPRPFEISQAARTVFMLFESDHWLRRIHTDGRSHPEGYPITWMGHSVGTWNGDTLVVDTIHINDRSWWLDNLAHPKSDALHVIERFRRPNQNTLEIDFTFDDPKAYTRPWTGKKVFALAEPGYEVLEDVSCEEYLDLGKKGRY